MRSPKLPALLRSGVGAGSAGSRPGSVGREWESSLSEQNGVPCPAVRQLHAPFSHRRLLLEWNVEAKAAFPAGTELFRVRHSPLDAFPLFVETLIFGVSLGMARLGGIGREHSYVSKEAGVLVWHAPGGWREVTSGELLGSWVSLSEWQVFAAMLERHEIHIRTERAGGASVEEANAAAVAECLAAVAAQRAELADLHLTRQELLRELEAARAAGSSAACLAGTGADGGDDLLSLLDHLSPPPDGLTAYAKAGGGEVLAGLNRAITELIGRDSPLPTDDLILIRADATFVEDFADSLARFDEFIAATLADPSLEEAERELRLEKWCDMRQQLLDEAISPRKR